MNFSKKDQEYLDGIKFSNGRKFKVAKKNQPNKKRVDFVYLEKDKNFINSKVKKYNPNNESITTQSKTYKEIFENFKEFSSDS